MKTNIILLMAAGLAGLLSSCSPVSVTTDYDRTVPFPKFKTYTLAPPAKGQTLSPGSEAALRDTLRAELAKKGILEKKSGKADLAIARHVFFQNKIAVHEYTDWGYSGGYWPYRYGFYDPWIGAPRTYVDVTQYKEGTLVLDFVDTRTNKLVFRGTGSGPVGKPNANAARTTEAVARIVAGLPVP